MSRPHRQVITKFPDYSTCWPGALTYIRGMELITTLLIIGVLLLVAEIFLPGGIAGILGILCLLGAVIISYVEFGSKVGNGVLFGVLAGLTAGAAFWLKYFPNSRAAKPFISQRVIGGLGVEQPDLLNRTGIAYTDLRPSGIAVIDGQRVDVVAENKMIPKGTEIKVVQVEGIRVVVRAI